MSAEFLLQGATIKRLLVGLGVTLRISLVSVALSIPFGVLMGVLFTRKNRMLQVVLRAYLNFIRVMPQLVLLYVVFFGSATTLGLNFSGEVASIIVFTLWGAAELGDLVRAALESIPRSQYDSSYVLGLTPNGANATALRLAAPRHPHRKDDQPLHAHWCRGGRSRGSANHRLLPLRLSAGSFVDLCHARLAVLLHLLATLHALKVA